MAECKINYNGALYTEEDGGALHAYHKIVYDAVKKLDKENILTEQDDVLATSSHKAAKELFSEIEQEYGNVIKELQIEDKTVYQVDVTPMRVEAVAQYLKDSKKSDYKKQEFIDKDLTTLKGIRQEILSTISLQINKMDASDTTSSTYKEALKELKKELASLDETEMRNSVLNYVKFTGDKIKLYNAIIENDIKTFDNDPKKALAILSSFSSTSKSFSIVNELQDQIDRGQLVNAKEFGGDEAFKNLKENIESVNDAYVKLQATIRNTSIPNIAKIFADISSKEVAKEKEKLEVEANRQGLEGEVRDKFIQDNLDESKEELKQSEFESKLKSLTKGPADITVIEAYFASEKNINSDVISMISKILDDATIQRDLVVQNELIDSSKIYDAFKKTGADPKKIYQGYYEEGSDGNLYITSKYSIEFLIEYRKLAEAFNDLTEEEKKTEEGKKIANAYFTFRKENTNNSVPIKKWLNPNFDNVKDTDIHKKLISLTKDIDAKLNKTQSNIKKYADIEFYGTPNIGKSGFENIASGNIISNVWESTKRIWQERADDTEFGNNIGLKEQQALDLKKEIDRRLNAGENISDLAAQVNNLVVLTNETGSIKKQIPIHYRGQQNLKDQSYDLLSILVMDFNMAENFHQKQKVRPVIELTIDALKTKKIEETAGLEAKSLMRQVGKGVFEKVKAKLGETSLEYKKAISMVDNRLYGITTADDFGGKKIARTLMGWTADAMLGANFLAASINVLQGKTMSFIESFGGQHFSNKDLVAAETKFFADSINWMNDIGRPVQSSKTNQLMNILDIQGEFKVLAEKFNENNRVKALMKKSAIYAGSKMGEFYMQSTLMYAILNNIKVRNKAGEYINKTGKVVSKEKAMSVDEAFSINDEGKLTINEHAHSTSFGDKVLSLDLANDKALVEIKALVNNVAMKLHGQYNEDIQSHAQRYVIGKMAFMLRKWVVPGFMARWKGVTTSARRKELLQDKDRHFSEDTQTFDEGYYTSFIRFLSTVISDWKRIGNLTSAWKEGKIKLTTTEAANLRKAAMELSLIAITFLSSILALLALDGIEEDDDEFLLFALFLNRRLYTELSFFANPKSTIEILRSPAASISYLEDSLLFLDQLVQDGYGVMFGDGLEIYERGKNKGLPKLWKRSTDLLPIFNHMNRSVYEATSYVYNTQ